MRLLLVKLLFEPEQWTVFRRGGRLRDEHRSGLQGKGKMGKRSGAMRALPGTVRVVVPVVIVLGIRVVVRRAVGGLGLGGVLLCVHERADGKTVHRRGGEEHRVQALWIPAHDTRPRERGQRPT
jgi:hypothetical protein